MCHDFEGEFSDWEDLIRRAAEVTADDGEKPREEDLAPPPIETVDVGEPELGHHEIDEPELD